MTAISSLDSFQRRRIAVVLPALLLPLAASFFYFVWFPGTVFGNSFYVGVKTFLLIWPFLAIFLILKETINTSGLPGPKNHASSVVLGGIFGILTVAVLMGLVKMTPIGDVLMANRGRIVDKIEGLGVRPYYLWFALFISFLHAALEEFFWRYFAFGQLRKVMSVGVAVLVAAIGFSLHHIVVLTQFVPVGMAFFFGACVGLGGAVWSLIYQRTNSLVGVWFSHMLIDLGIMWVGWEVLQAT